jgi:phage tail sheath gpL-like
MPISFNEITNLRVPYIRVEYDSSAALAGPSIQPYKAMALGLKTNAGTATTNTIYSVTSADQAKLLFGPGSVLHNIAQSYFADPAVTDFSAIAVAEPTGVNATAGISITGPATAAGTIALYIAGKVVNLAVASGDTAATVASGLVSAINARTDLPCTAAIDGVNNYEIDLTAKQKGLVGNLISVQTNFFETDSTPAGLVLTITGFASGSGNPSLTSAFAAMGDTHYNILISPWTDTTTLDAIELELDSRGSASRMIEAICFSALADTVSNANIVGNSQNSKWLSIANIKGCPNLGYEIAAAIAKKVMIAGNIDPARPFQTLSLTGIIAPKVANRNTVAEQESQLNNGISTINISSTGEVAIQRLITTYKTNAGGSPDTSYLDVNTLLTLSYIRYDFRNSLALKFPRHKLANDSDRIAAGQAVITPMIGKAHAIAKFREWENMVLVEDFNQFKADLVVERNAQNPNRLDFLLPINLVNQFLQAGVKLGFIL